MDISLNFYYIDIILFSPTTSMKLLLCFIPLWITQTSLYVGNVLHVLHQPFGASGMLEHFDLL